MLYSILAIKKETEENIKVDVEINPKHPVFEGHFPGNPVLPGACMVQMMKAVLQEARQFELEFHKGHNIKYISLVQPGENNVLTFHIQTKPTPEGLLSVNNTLYAGDVVCMKFSGTYKIK